MTKEDEIKLYFLIKERLLEDMRKSDIKEIAQARFPNMTEEEFNTEYSDAFCNL